MTRRTRPSLRAVVNLPRPSRDGRAPNASRDEPLHACVDAIVGELSTLGFGDRQLLELALPLHDALYARCEGY